MPAVSIAGWVLAVRSSRSFGPSRISRAMSSPSAVEASSSVCRTAALSPQASSMPTACEPWPGKTKANGFMRTVSRRALFGAVASEIEQGRAPGEAAAHAFEHHRVATLDLACAHGVVKGQRDRGGRGVAVPVDGDDQLFRRELELLRRALH